MSPVLFIISITCYLVSMAAALTASFFSRLIPDRFINTFIIFHFLSLITWFILPNEINNNTDAGTKNYFFLIFFCSGILAAGFILRKNYIIYLKIYFSIFLLSLLVFIVSPSRVIGFVSSGDVQSINPKRYHISENYFFVEQRQSETASPSTTSAFKVVREMGMFHKTLAREVLLPSNTDSVKLISISENENLIVRVYSQKENKTDSLDLNIRIGVARDSSRVITRNPSLTK